MARISRDSLQPHGDLEGAQDHVPSISLCILRDGRLEYLRALTVLPDFPHDQLSKGLRITLDELRQGMQYICALLRSLGAPRDESLLGSGDGLFKLSICGDRDFRERLSGCGIDHPSTGGRSDWLAVNDVRARSGRQGRHVQLLISEGCVDMEDGLHIQVFREGDFCGVHVDKV